MDCCETDGFKRPVEIREKPTLEKTVRRRGVLKGAALVAGATPFVASGVKTGAAKSTTIQLAFCSQLLCVPPYEVTRDGGYFRDEGLDVQLVYMRGSTAAMQALVGGAVDYAATSFDDVLQAFNRGAEIKRFYSTARLPLLALAIAPNRVAEINSFKDLEGRTSAIVSRGSLAEAMTLFLMKKAGADGKKSSSPCSAPTSTSRCGSAKSMRPGSASRRCRCWSRRAGRRWSILWRPTTPTNISAAATNSWASRSEPQKWPRGASR